MSVIKYKKIRTGNKSVKETATPYRAGHKFTYSDLEHIADDHTTYELFDGEIVVSPRPRPDHQRIMVNLTRIISNHAHQYRLGVLLPETEIHFSKYRLLVPDLTFVYEKKKRLIGEKYITGAPDWVCEILSPAGTQRDRSFKLSVYEEEGIPEYWIIDAKKNVIEVYQLTGGMYEKPVIYSGNQKVRSAVFEKIILTAHEVFE